MWILDRISQKQTQGFCAAGGALRRVRVELQLPRSGAGRVTGHGRKMSWGSGCGRSGVLPAVWGQGIKELLQNSCCAGPGSASEGVKCLPLVWGSYLSSIDVLTCSSAEPMVTSNCRKLPRVLRFYLSLWLPEPTLPSHLFWGELQIFRLSHCVCQ